MMPDTILDVADLQTEIKQQEKVRESIDISMNFHQNYIDISDEHYQAQMRLKQQRAHNLANVWMGMLGKDLKNLYQADRKKIYQEQFKAGASLSLLQIKQLDSEIKKDYFTEIIARDKNTTLKVKQTF